jgi:hypothetical protein
MDVVVRRIFWAALGASLGVLIARSLRAQAEQARESLTPGSILTNVADSVTGFLDEVRAGMSEREEELRSGLGLDDDN